MNLTELFIIAVGLSMDAFAVAVCSGLTMRRVTVKKSLIVGLYFGFFQGMMPLIGYLLATQPSFLKLPISILPPITPSITKAIQWSKATILSASFKKEGCADRECPAGTCTDRKCPGGERPNTEEASLKPGEMLPLAVATSIDNSSVTIPMDKTAGTMSTRRNAKDTPTARASMLGVKIGNIFGSKFKSKAEFAGGVILMLMGLKILLEHTGIIGF